ncbi:acetate kinase [Myxococcota bacterium]|nr:acetate kinase [Myxococcota bacterium]MBU1432527.1 acetate kinase [Myxococcota bacterium]MBU1897885.1 acetate kinase [Myxococcota bacterium]
MKVLVLNCGSSSIKYQLLEMPAAELLAKGLIERIGEPEGYISQTVGGIKQQKTLPIADHGVGLREALSALTQGEGAPLADLDEIEAVGHRVVHGGEDFTGTVVIDEAVLDALRANVPLAPLHNPANILGIEVAQRTLPCATQVGVFDTAFHQTMPPHAYLYAIPKALYREDRVRRYGFHGTSHRFVTAAAAEALGRPVEALNLITCHLGNGASVAAIAGGRSIDTSMGLTPLEGLVMGTRSGDLDPALIFHIARAKGLSLDAVDKLLNKQSGLLGLSGQSNDCRVLEERAEAGDEDALLALEVFAYRLKKYIGAYSAALGRVDAVIFTAGIGENSPWVRAHACAGLEILGIKLDEAKNNTRGVVDISAAEATTRVLVLPTNEERLIAEDTYALAQKP